MNRSAEAVSAYDSALALHPEIPEIWNSRGEALLKDGRYAEARDSFDKALKIAPYYTKALQNRNLTQKSTLTLSNNVTQSSTLIPNKNLIKNTTLSPTKNPVVVNHT